MAKKGYSPRSVAFLTNLIGVEMLSFALYANVDEAFDGPGNYFVFATALFSALFFIITLVLVEFNKLEGDKQFDWLIGFASEVAISFFPAGLTNLNSGNLILGFVFVMISAAGVFILLKYLWIFTSFFTE